MAVLFTENPEEIGLPNTTFVETVRGALALGGYPKPDEQVLLPSLTAGRRFQLDMMMQPSVGGPILIQMYYQSGPGSAEERVPYMALQLISSVRRLGPRAHGYLILDGDGIRNTAYFTKDLCKNLRAGTRITILELLAFEAMACAGQLYAAPTRPPHAF